MESPLQAFERKEDESYSGYLEPSRCLLANKSKVKHDSGRRGSIPNLETQFEASKSVFGELKKATNFGI